MKARTAYEAAIAGAAFKDGDYLTIANAWATVTLIVEVDGEARIFKNTSDVVQFDTQGHCLGHPLELAFPSAKDAINNALASIAHFAKERNRRS
jgi:hypothetical protein